MSGTLHPPLTRPKDGAVYQFIAVARVSDPTPGKQDLRSLGDQEASYRKFLDLNTTAPYELTMIAGSGSGELLNRAEYQRLLDAVGTRRYDLVLCEDLGRIVRRIHAHLVCEECEDHDTRLIALNDRVDTALSNWRESSIFAAFHHERANRDTSERIKRTLKSRFMGGGCLRGPVYGWVKPPGAKSDADLRKDPAAEEVYREWFRKLDEDGASFADIAGWLNEKKAPVTPWKRARAEWDGKMVARHTYNVLLKGVRERNHRRTRRRNNPGKYVSEKAPAADLLQRRVPHLAFFDEAYYDRVVGNVRARNAWFRRSDDPAADPCLRRPRKHSRCPGGGVAVCGICGRPFVWGGNGQADHLMCNGAREHRCWMGVTFDGADAARRAAGAILGEAERLPDFDAAFLQIVDAEAKRLDEGRERRVDDLARTVAQTEREVANVVRAIRRTDAEAAGAALAAELTVLERQLTTLRAEHECARRAPSEAVRVPPVDELKQLARAGLADLAAGDKEFAAAFARLVPRMVVFPYRLCDGGGVVLRAQFRLRLAALLADRRAADLLRGPLERELTVDLFDPPQREACRTAVVAARAAGATEREAAARCGITVTAAQRAAALQRRMDELGLVDPYVPVMAPPDDLPKLRRHLADGYRFEPLPGAGEL